MTHASKKDPIEKAEMAGRGGDRLLGHLTPGDVIIPRGMVSEELKQMLAQMFDVDVYTAGSEKNSINPMTGLPEFYDMAAAEANAGKEGDNGLGANPGQNGAMGFGQGLGGLIDAIGGALANPGPVGNSTMDGMGTGGGMDSLNQPPTNQLMQAAPPPAVNYGTAIAPLPMPTAPNVPDSLPQIGQYYNLLRFGNTAGAENLLSPYLRGDRNIYGVV